MSIDGQGCAETPFGQKNKRQTRGKCREKPVELFHAESPLDFLPRQQRSDCITKRTLGERGCTVCSNSNEPPELGCVVTKRDTFARTAGTTPQDEEKDARTPDQRSTGFPAAAREAIVLSREPRFRSSLTSFSILRVLVDCFFWKARSLISIKQSNKRTVPGK